MYMLADKLLKENKISFTKIRNLATYKRLILIIESLPEKAADTQIETKGPPADLLKDKNGNYTKQAVGFAKKYGLKPQDLTVIKTNKADFLYAKKILKGEKTQKLLTGIFTDIIKNLTFPKTMVWEESGFRFARPIRNILALYGDKTVSFKLADVKSCNFTYGLSALGSPKIKIKDAGSYEKIIETKNIVLRNCSNTLPSKEIESILNKTAEKKGKVIRNINLFLETIFLVENPAPLLCEFDKDFLKLPRNLITTMFARHMKCFAIEKNGKLTPYFIAVLDGVKKNHTQIKKGYENVAKARLEDARFFYEQDLKTGMEKMRKKLAEVLFHEKIGSMLDKTNRIKQLSKLIAESLMNNIEIDEKVIEKTADFCYADLTSQAVGEFPELQGYMGSVYAGKAGFDSKTCKALEEFYYPLTADMDSPLSSTLEGAIVSLADKIDTLACNFALGFIPTGSEDPHGLRRQAMGVVRIIINKDFDFGKGGFGFPRILGHSLDILQENFKNAPDKMKLFEQLKEFLWHRFETLYQNEFKFDEFRTIKQIAMKNLNLNIPFPDILKRLKALNTVRQDENFNTLAVGFKRVANILKKINENYTVNPALFKQEQENKLCEEIKKIQKTNAELIGKKDYETAFINLIGLKPFIDSFFDNVMVMDKDEELKQNRLALMQELHKLFTEIADLSRLQ